MDFLNSNLLRSFCLVVLLFSLQSHGAGVSLSRGVIRGLESKVGQQILSQMTGQSLSQVSSMSSAARQQALTRALDGVNDPSLRNKVFSSLSNPSPTGVQQLVSSSLFQKAFTSTKIQSAARNLVTSKSNSISSLGQNAKAALAMLRGRRDMDTVLVDKFASVVRNASKSLGFDVLGRGASHCMKSYDAPLVRNFISIVSSLGGSRAVVSSQTAFQTMVNRSMGIFKENQVAARKRVCGLAGKGGYNCQALNGRLCPL